MACNSKEFDERNRNKETNRTACKLRANYVQQGYQSEANTTVKVVNGLTLPEIPCARAVIDKSLLNNQLPVGLAHWKKAESHKVTL
jgi:hypothetical protein